MQKFLAFLCRICPFCAYARRRPDSSFAAALRKAEKSCPACKAYYELYKKPAQGKTTDDRTQ